MVTILLSVFIAVLGLFGQFRARLAPSRLHLSPSGPTHQGPFGLHLAPPGPIYPTGSVKLAITPLVSNGSNYSLRIVNLSHFWALRAPLDPLRGSPRGRGSKLFLSKLVSYFFLRFCQRKYIKISNRSHFNSILAVFWPTRGPSGPSRARAGGGVKNIFF